MNRSNGDLPAMPIYLTDAIIGAAENGADEIVNRVSGLTKREQFAAMAMQACRSRNSSYPDWESLAKDAVEIADALLAELEESK